MSPCWGAYLRTTSHAFLKSIHPTSQKKSVGYFGVLFPYAHYPSFLCSHADVIPCGFCGNCSYPFTFGISWRYMVLLPPSGFSFLKYLSGYYVSIQRYYKIMLPLLLLFFLDLRFQRVCWLPCGWETVAGEGTEDWLGSCHDNVRRGRNGKTKLHYGDEEQRQLQNILERENQESLLMDRKWSVRKTEHYSTDLSLHIKDQLAIF